MGEQEPIIRRAEMADERALADFFDAELAGRVGDNDFYVPRMRVSQYVRTHKTLVMYAGTRMVGCAVSNPASNTLIHLLVARDCRGKGYGSALLRAMAPDVIRAKTDQSYGNPVGFYERMGFAVCEQYAAIGRKKNIALMTRVPVQHG